MIICWLHCKFDFFFYFYFFFLFFFLFFFFQMILAGIEGMLICGTGLFIVCFLQ